MRLEILQALLARAAEEPFGLVLEVVNPKLAVNELSEANRDSDEIIICTPSIPNTVFLVKRSVELDP